MTSGLTIGVLALQGAFEEHQACIEKATGCKTIQVRVYISLDLRSCTFFHHKHRFSHNTNLTVSLNHNIGEKTKSIR